MVNNRRGVVEGLPSPSTIKVHVRMCSELLNLVVRVSEIIPEIEEARPRASGMEALCSLNNGVDKAMSLLQHCCESSVLYLSLTGDAILSRCNKLKNLLEHSLGLILNMVPLVLAAKISGIILTIRCAVFYLEPNEEEAGKVLKELVHRYGSSTDSKEEFAFSSIRLVCSRLHISSKRDLAIERRSIRKIRR
ncbi:PREDICTED: U-box domain-containing protein 5-like [Erythranthe guttata]|uniref:U-box domain-containing protein 5-like n=1 Tax=Erythranthe guttata TaxID=4155 RepID=UPI00064DF80A|nr:PREDICTED: U-box domain-containing protein 5-like [Erythranthe guttata]XP_012834095.1 PREDICTED: U-box domain-containing protein 5-like [Erythranthe guttata]|eukprot:XP_012834094.1 PREDICTED: U-box domain-containing protein 5-like [Erythranthe guttata]